GSTELPVSFMAAWNGFVRQFGYRGPMEMDVAHPRYADVPLIALRQVVAMSVDDANSDPVSAARRQVERRRKAAATVMERSGVIRRGILRRLNTVIELFAGLRDTPKQHLLMILHDLRRRIVLEGERLHRLGRLDEPAHVFDLTFEELAAAGTGPGLDLRAIRAERRKYYDHLATQVINFPPVIDSRGRILRQPRGACRDGEFCGVGLSPGLVSGFARTLRSPHEKPLLKGEVLIAYTTDPGWTPIFSNAAAVVLEIGGALQHGAVVARELGLPCVAGIGGISTAIKDGQLVEVDGSAGTVRLLPAASV
ncbi:MAG: PEP-utilizing enzyme, partial [Lysobacter sp.]